MSENEERVKNGIIVLDNTDSYIRFITKIKFAKSKTTAYMYLPYRPFEKFKGEVVIIEVKKAKIGDA